MALLAKGPLLGYTSSPENISCEPHLGQVSFFNVAPPGYGWQKLK
jgi:hypothetical protein